MSIQELAERSGLNEHTISDIERGIRKPRATTIAKLAEALELSPEELLGKAPAPPASGQPSARKDARGGDELVPLDVGMQRILAAGAAARQVARVWPRELARSLEESKPLTTYRTAEMYSFHNELSRLYTDTFKSILEGARLGLVGLTIEGTNEYLSADPTLWPGALKERLYEAGARIAALPPLIQKIERESSEQRQATGEQALYQEFNVEDHLSPEVTEDLEWREAVDKARAEIEA